MPINTDISDLWWLRPGPNTAGQALSSAFDRSQRNREFNINREDRQLQDALRQSNFERDFGQRALENDLQNQERRARIAREVEDTQMDLKASAAFDKAMQEQQGLNERGAAISENEMLFNATKAMLPLLRRDKLASALNQLNTLGARQQQAEEMNAIRRDALAQKEDYGNKLLSQRAESEGRLKKTAEENLALRQEIESKKLDPLDKAELDSLTKSIIESNHARAAILKEKGLDPADMARKLVIHDTAHRELLKDRETLRARLGGGATALEGGQPSQTGTVEPKSKPRMIYDPRSDSFTQIDVDGVPVVSAAEETIELPGGRVYRTQAAVNKKTPKVERAELQTEIRDLERFLEKAGEGAPTEKDVTIPAMAAPGMGSMTIVPPRQGKTETSKEERAAQDAKVVAASKRLKDLKARLNLLLSDLNEQ